MIQKIVEEPKSIYGHLKKYLGEDVVQDSDYTSKINYFLNHFYIRLSAQTYCKKNNIKLDEKNQISEQLKDEILNYIGE